MTDAPVLSLRVKPALKRKLDKIAASLDRPRSWVVTQALESYVEQQAWQIEEIKRGLAEADAGDFASDEEVEKTFEKWRGKKHQPRRHAR